MKEAQFRIDDSFIRVNQSATSRLDLDRTPPAISGLLTVGLATCVAIIIVSSDQKKISLTHTATAADANDLLRECDWAGDHCTIFIIKGSAYIDPAHRKMFEQTTTLLPRLRAALQERSKRVLFAQEFSDRFPYAVAVTRHLQVQFFGMNDRSRVRNIEKGDFWGLTADHFELRETMDLIHTHSCTAGCFPGQGPFLPMLEKKYHLLDLQYDGEKWLPMPVLPVSTDYFLKDPKVAGGNIALARFILIKFSKLYSNKYSQEIESIKNKATQLYMARNLNGAIEEFDKAIYIVSIFYSGNPMRTGVPWLDEVREKLASLNYNAGMVYKYMGKHDLAQHHVNQSLIIRRGIFGEGNNTTIKTKVLYGELSLHIKKEKILNDVRANYPALGLYSHSDLVSMGLVSKRGKELVEAALTRVNAAAANERDESKI